MEQLSYWEESTIPNHIKYDGGPGSRSDTPNFKEEQQSLYRYCDSVSGNLNFSTVATSEDDDYSYHKKKLSRDPMSHRIIEKRRRDRMNNCLADLSRLIPADYMKKGRGRIEKTEIIEMAIKHMKHLQDHHANCHLGNCEISHHQSVESEESYSPPESNTSLNLKVNTPALPLALPNHEVAPTHIIEEHYRLGYHECLSETMHFLVEVEGMYAGDKLCVQLISHLQRHCDKILKDGGLNAPRENAETTSSSSMGSKERERSSASGSGSSSDGSERPPRIPPSTDDVYYPSNASQLREILTHSQNRLKIVAEPTSPCSSINGSYSQTENHSQVGSLYKFKNNIKQRFSAEHSHNGVSEQSQPIALKRRRSDDRRHTSETSLPSSPPLKYPSSPSPLPGVPIFALHSKGSFYIPLTIDHHVLAPFLSELTSEMSLPSLVLHPVTISVNFQQSVSRPLKQPLCFTQASAPWSSQNNYLTLPKWATCAPDRN